MCSFFWHATVGSIDSSCQIHEKDCTGIFMSNTFTRKMRLKLAKISAKAKQNPEPELILKFENYSRSSYTYLLYYSWLLQKEIGGSF